jgi:hypothetical protein
MVALPSVLHERFLEAIRKTLIRIFKVIPQWGMGTEIKTSELHH